MEPLVGSAEIRIRLGGVSPQRVHAITKRSDFPAPVAVLIMGRVWSKREVEAWIREHRVEVDDQGDA